MANNLVESNIEMIKSYIQDGIGYKESIIEYAKTLDRNGFIILIENFQQAYDGFIMKVATGKYPDFKINEHGDEARDIAELYTELAKIEGAPIDKLAEAVISTEDIYWMYVFARDIPDAPVVKISDVFIEMLMDNFYDAGVLAEYMFYFAKDVSGAPVESLAMAVLKSDDVFTDSDACGYLNEFSYLVDEPFATILKARYEQAKDYHGDNVDEIDQEDEEFADFGYFYGDDMENY